MAIILIMLIGSYSGSCKICNHSAQGFLIIFARTLRIFACNSGILQHPQEPLQDPQGSLQEPRASLQNSAISLKILKTPFKISLKVFMRIFKDPS